MTTTNDQLIRALQAINDALQALIAEGKPEPVIEPPRVDRPTPWMLDAADVWEMDEPRRARRKWTQQEHDDLLVLCRYMPDREVAALLGRTPKAIEDRRLNATNVRRIAS
jgi:hypothetical protein